MPRAGVISLEAASQAADAVTRLLNRGFLRIYGGRKPVSAEITVIAARQPLLAELRFAPAAFEPARDGVAIAREITRESLAMAEGTATWFRAFRADGRTPVFDGSVGLNDADLVLDDIDIRRGAEVSVDQCVYTQITRSE